MEVQVIDNLKDKIERDKKFKPKTPPQIPLDLYCKWLTDKYNKTRAKLLNRIGQLEAKLKTANNKLKILENTNTSNRLKYQNEKGEFLKELYKEDLVLRHQKEIKNKNNTIENLRNSVDSLIAENIKLKKQLENERTYR